ncbi:hypothetical protein ACSBR2_041751 [Camellia fascicularis]
MSWVMAYSGRKQRKMACSSSSKRPHVLAVDDSLVDRKLIKRLLTNSACKLTTVENGQRALEFLGLGDGQHSINNSDSKVNLIIINYCMPGMSGIIRLERDTSSDSVIWECPDSNQEVITHSYTHPILAHLLVINFNLSFSISCPCINSLQFC